MSESAPPPPPPENQGAPVPPPPPAAAPPPPAPYGSAPPPPAAGAVGPQPGSLLDRFLARFIDGIIVGVITAILQVFIGLAISSSFVAAALGGVIAAIIYLGYFAFLESNRGQTIGKQIMKLRVISASGSGNPTMNEAVKRNIWTGAGILGIVPILGTLLGGLLQLAAVIMCAVTINSDTVRRQSWFDKFAGGTQVLKEG